MNLKTIFLICALIGLTVAQNGEGVSRRRKKIRRKIKVESSPPEVQVQAEIPVNEDESEDVVGLEPQTTETRNGRG